MLFDDFLDELKKYIIIGDCIPYGSPYSKYLVRIIYINKIDNNSLNLPCIIKIYHPYRNTIIDKVKIKKKFYINKVSIKYKTCAIYDGYDKDINNYILYKSNVEEFVKKILQVIQDLNPMIKSVEI